MAMIERTLPWQRGVFDQADDLRILLDLHQANHEGESSELISKAYQWAFDAHDGQVRKSGEPYIQHPLEVARIVAEQGLDAVSIASALMHDAVEDTDVALSDLEEEFGLDVARIIDGCTKVDRLQFESKEAQQAATIRKLLVAIAKDIRVLIIKLADRLHNMRTLAVLPEWKQQRTAGETLHVFAPLAHRLGMEDLKNQLEDLAFAALHPKWYAEIDHMVAMRAPERDLYLTQVVGEVEARLLEVGIGAEVTGRPKNLWSIYEKMVVRGREFNDIYDLVGIRVVCDSVRDCYGALGSIHAQWKPLQGRFKDYIAMPKFNLYQSLHTTVIGPQGKMVEVQVRTEEMHARAERGVAAHWAYKGGTATDDLAWLNRIIGFSEETADPNEFMANLKVDLEQNEVLAFTPKGKIISLSVGATPVDFAYSVHTEVGHACVGAKVNGRLVALDTRLQSGDVVEVFTSASPDAGPSQEWLKFVATHRAANKIRAWHSREAREDAIATARDDVSTALRRAGLPVHEVMTSTMLDKLAADMNYVDREAVFAAIGDGHISPNALVSRAEKLLSHAEPEVEDRLPTTALAPNKSDSSDRSSVGVHIEGLDDMWIRLAKCCKPVPPDDIMAFMTRGRGVSVHRSDCANAMSLAAGQSGRVVDAEWDVSGTGTFVATIEVKALDRTRLLLDVANAMSDRRVNILAANTRTGADRISIMRFDFELGDSAQIESILRSVGQIDGVYDAHRVLPGEDK